MLISRSGLLSPNNSRTAQSRHNIRTPISLCPIHAASKRQPVRVSAAVVSGVTEPLLPGQKSTSSSHNISLEQPPAAALHTPHTSSTNGTHPPSSNGAQPSSSIMGGSKAAPSPSSAAAVTVTTSSNSTAVVIPAAGPTSTPSSSSTARDDFAPPAWAPQPLVNFARSTEFFGRVAHIYGAYKLTQLRAAVMRAQGRSAQEITETLWDGQHTWAGQQMYDLCISLRGFYLKAGQFIGARADFVPDQICRKLCLLQDQVPPMSPARAKQVVCEELGIDDLSEVFEWINLQEPIGSASISQVHKAQLRRFQPDQLRHLKRREGGLLSTLPVRAGDTAWGICNSHGISLAELAAANRDVDLDRLQPGQVLKVPVVLGLEHFQQQQQQQRAAASSSHGGWFGLGRLLHRQQHGSTGGVDSATTAGEVAEQGDDGTISSSSGSSSDDWLEAGTSLLAAGRDATWQRHLSSKRQHLLQLVSGRSSASSSSSSGGGGGSLRGMLGASDSEEDHESGSSSSTAAMPDVHSPAAAAVAHAAAAGQVPDGGLVAVKIQYPGALQTMTLDLVNLRSVSAFLQKTELQFDLVSAVDELQKQIHLEFDFMREARVMDTIAQHLSTLSHKVTVPRSVPGLVSQRLMVMSFIDGTPLMQLRDKVAHLPKWKRDKAARLILSQVSQAYGLMILGEGLFQADGHPGNILVQKGGRVALLDYGQSKQLEEVDKLAFADLILAMNRSDKRAISEALWRLHVSTSTDDAGLRSDMAYGMFDTRGKVDPFDPNSPIKQAAIEKFPPDMFFVLRVVQLLRGMANGMGIEDFSTADQWAPLAKQAVARAQKKARRRKAADTWRAQPLFDLAAYTSPLRLTI